MPYSFDDVRWHWLSDPTRLLQCLVVCVMNLQFKVLPSDCSILKPSKHTRLQTRNFGCSQVVAFFLKYILWVPPTNPLNTYRLIIWFCESPFPNPPHPLMHPTHTGFMPVEQMGIRYMLPLPNPDADRLPRFVVFAGFVTMLSPPVERFSQVLYRKSFCCALVSKAPDLNTNRPNTTS